MKDVSQTVMEPEDDVIATREQNHAVKDLQEGASNKQVADEDYIDQRSSAVK